MEDWKLSRLETLLAKGSRDREGASTAEVSLLAKGSRDREVAPTEEVCVRYCSCAGVLLCGKSGIGVPSYMCACAERERAPTRGAPTLTP